MMKKALLLSLLLTLPLWLQAQVKNVSGQVTSSVDGLGLPGVNVVIKGTSSGTVTDIDGKYSLKVPEGGTQIIFSYIGYISQEITIGSQSTIDIKLAEDTYQLDAVVVTAFGMEREQKALGYSVQKVDGAAVAEAKEVNVANALSGKIAGISVSKTASGPSGSSRVVIRGNNSLTGNNQPLYVVDGMPIDNQNLDGAGRWGGIDYGDGIGDINSDDIADISVLKGPNAAALYGSRGANGVIIITTKTGNKGKNKGVGIEYTGNFTFENIMISPEYQNAYGHGTNGKVPESTVDVLNLGSSNSVDGTTFATSWGAPTNGSQQLFWDGQTRAYTAQPDNFNNFWNTGQTFTNTIALNGGNESADFRVSYTNLSNKGIMPNQEFNRNTLTARGRIDLTDRLSTDVKLTYTKSSAFNRPNLADIMENPVNGLIWMPRTVSIDQIQNYADELGNPLNYTSETFRLNPYWAVNRNQNQDSKERLIGMAYAKYKISENIGIDFRTGIDQYTSDRKRWVAKRTTYRPDGEVQSNIYQVREMNTTLNLTFNKDLTEDISLSGIVGGNILAQSTKQLGYYASPLMTENLYNAGNGASVTTSENLFEKEIWSSYAQLSLAYKGMLFLDITGRNDRSSTLPIDNNSYFYPSVTGSWAFSESFNLEGSAFTFGKIRASWAKVGSDADPYRLSLAYGAMGSHGSAFMFGVGPQLNQFVPDHNIPNQNLKPESTTAIEIGADLRFFNDRVGVDFAYYKSSTSNQILPLTVPTESGFDEKIINAGIMSNQGVEVQLRATPIRTESGFEFSLGVNWARNTNTVEELDEEGQLPVLLLGADRGVDIVARPGGAYGDIMGFDFERDDNGNALIDDAGMPIISGQKTVLGNILPDWRGGVSFAFKYKGLYLNTLLDIKQGGDIFSQTNRYLHLNGNHANTVEGREAWYNGTGGYVAKGVNANTGQANTTAVDPQQYWRTVADAAGAGSPFVYDGSYIKLREFSLGYELPGNMVSKTPFQAVRVSLVGRNLFFLQNNLPGIDPEATFNAGNAGGRESASFPSTRSFGINLNISL